MQITWLISLERNVRFIVFYNFLFHNLSVFPSSVVYLKWNYETKNLAQKGEIWLFPASFTSKKYALFQGEKVEKVFCSRVTNLIYSWVALIFMPRNYENFIIYSLCSGGPSLNNRLMLESHETYGLWISVRTWRVQKYMY